MVYTKQLRSYGKVIGRGVDGALTGGTGVPVWQLPLHVHRRYGLRRVSRMFGPAFE